VTAAPGTTAAPATLHNGASIPRARVPRLAWTDFRSALLAAVDRGQRVAALFATAAPGTDAAAAAARSAGAAAVPGAPAAPAGPAGPAAGATADRPLLFWAVLADDHAGVLHVATTLVEGDSFPSLTPHCPQVHLFEREIAEQWGVRPDGHPWLKPVRFQPSRRGADSDGDGAGGSDRVGAHAGAPARAGGTRAEPARPVVGVTDYFRVEGDEVHEVAVGPVHAGIIEPGHFRFQCHGETVFHLEISLGYQHRGVERAVLAGPTKRVIHYMETLAGDTTIGHATAYCQLAEALADCRPPPRALALRGIALELERLANHTGGLGALANDVGFLPTASYCGRLRGDFLNLTAALCGSRFGRGLVRPGGAAFDVDGTRAADMEARLAAAARDVAGAVGLLWTTSSVGARFEGTGKVAHETARELGLVGVAARACGLARDVRQSLPAGIFRFAHIPMCVWHTGDVSARAHVRWLEIQRSAAFVGEELRRLPGGAARVPCGAPLPGRFAVSLVEGWRGEICHVAATDAAGRVDVYKIVDPSFHNWQGLAMALRNEQVSDFPLCNKSFDLSYCGYDL
jgi:Ni,Fe-hydrogenase III large subunit